MIEFLVQNKQDGKIYDVSGLITDITYTDVLNNGCSKLEFSYIDDNLKLSNGSVVHFKYDGINLFYGYVFKTGRNKGRKKSVTAYDQLRYLKAKDIIVIKDMTIGELLKKACLYFNLRASSIASISYKLPTSVQDNKTWLDMLYEGISDTLLGTEKKYVLRDEFGYLALRDIGELKLNLVLGDKSLCYNFDYKQSIDDNTYNLIKLVRENEESGHADVYIAQNSKSFSKWGLLQYFEKVDKDTSDAIIKSKADTLLKILNREEESLDLNCIGDTSVRAGCSIVATLEDISLDKRLIVNKVVHKFLPVHTMNVELIL